MNLTEIGSKLLLVYCTVMFRQFPGLYKLDKLFYSLGQLKQLQSFKSSVKVPSQSQSVIRYAEYLRDVYKRQLLPVEKKLQPKSTKQFVNLAMIHKQKEKQSELDAFTSATIHGSVDDIVETKKSIVLQDIGKLEDGSLPCCILIHGAPGVGKTTLAWEMCRQWGEGRLLQQFSLVILLKMRDITMQEATDVTSLFSRHDLELQKIVSKEVTQNRGASILLFLEGYDELPQEMQKDSIFASILEGQVLPKATVAVTSRTSSSDSVFEKIKATKFQHIEVVGFTKQQIQTYISDAIDDEEVLENLHGYLKKYPHIHGLMYNPLNCSIVVDVYTSGNRSDDPPKTQTELYTSLTKTLLRRYLSTHLIHGKQKWLLSSFAELPPDVHAIFLELCEVAYKGMLHNRVVFQDIPPTQDTLGLMQAVPELYGPEKVTHNFLHLTLQEYLCAVHISSFPERKLVKSFESLFGKQHLVVVLRFLAGLTKFNLHQAKNASFLTKVAEFFRMRKSLTKCVVTLQHDRSGFIETLHWLFEAQEKELLTFIFGQGTQEHDLSFYSLSPFDCHVLGYCIAQSACKWKIDLRSCGISEDDLKMITGESDASLHNIATLDLCRNSIGSEGEISLGMCVYFANAIWSHVVQFITKCSYRTNQPF